MAKHVSEVEDGFALKRQRENAKRGKKRKVKGECTIPPPSGEAHPQQLHDVQPDQQAGNLRLCRDPSTREKVQHAERVMSEHVVGHDLRLLGCTHRQGSLLGNHVADQPVLATLLPKSRLHAVVPHRRHAQGHGSATRCSESEPTNLGSLRYGGDGNKRRNPTMKRKKPKISKPWA